MPDEALKPRHQHLWSEQVGHVFSFSDFRSRRLDTRMQTIDRLQVFLYPKGTLGDAKFAEAIDAAADFSTRDG
jgi:hypothetical protein